ncbi:MAG: NAD-dependent epimerase/dehydratase family protein [Bdellovibrionales bacterium]|jgi:nucleoside-diphosphate-sugar epimerase|nr:NAD-dependent epimerase/dehydratase family protein [Bdellovibrionales bacterium]MBT3525683.1 NAD-dependent epimerase/dehydratase family protein [Bdellovibrionales bacterium]MBT7669463.1 NAD-dependent epimerase/dehydratase family protein [Bdellovibrionales bacterium]MBT7768245.1 NAD-dependent epimerase/dehydratase family protein [Bdellovibrionales bacterium]
MTRKRRVLITGATGFLGRRLVSAIYRDYDELLLLVRKESLARAKRLFNNISNCKFIVGDLTDSEILDDESDLRLINNSPFDVIHMAALYSLEVSDHLAYINNVAGTQHLLHLLEQCSQCMVFYHISTIAVSGDFKGVFYESDLDCGQSWSNPYARTKFVAEELVRSWQHQVTKVIIRPGIVVGDSQSGDFDKIDGPYYLLDRMRQLCHNRGMRLLSKLIWIVPFPYDPKASLPLITVDDVVSGVQQIVALPPHNHLLTFHLTGESSGVPVSLFLNDMLRFFKLTPRIIPIGRNTPLIGRFVSLIGLPEKALDYLFQSCRYDQANVKKYLPNLQCKRYADFSKRMFSKFLL